MQDELRQRKEEEMDDYASQVLVALLPLFDVFGIITPVLLFRLGRLFLQIHFHSVNSSK
jgi:hypothetical protein